MNRKRLTQVVCLIVCFLMMSIAWLREGRLFGHDLTTGSLFKASEGMM